MHQTNLFHVFIMQAKPVPHFGVPLALPAASKRSTVPEPFSFSGRKPGVIFPGVVVVYHVAIVVS